jgi:GNAT superfamily N-acetyltransferase
VVTPTQIRPAVSRDCAVVSSILSEAASWLEARGEPVWVQDELLPERIVGNVESGLYVIGERGGVPAGIVRFQLDDPLFWPDCRPGEAAYIHRLAVRRANAGSGVSTDLLKWAVERAGELGLGFLRLDCRHDRPRLRELRIPISQRPAGRPLFRSAL